jgi:hypothetical protein
MQYDPTDPDAVASEERLAAVRQQRDLADLRTVLALAEGRRWIWRVLEQTAAFRASYDPDNPIRMAFAEGRRSTGLWLLAELQHAAPEAFASLIAETYAASQLPTPTTDEDDFLT